DALDQQGGKRRSRQRLCRVSVDLARRSVGRVLQRRDQPGREPEQPERLPGGAYRLGPNRGPRKEALCTAPTTGPRWCGSALLVDGLEQHRAVAAVAEVARERPTDREHRLEEQLLRTSRLALQEARLARLDRQILALVHVLMDVEGLDVVVVPVDAALIPD